MKYSKTIFVISQNKSAFKWVTLIHDETLFFKIKYERHCLIAEGYIIRCTIRTSHPFSIFPSHSVQHGHGLWENMFRMKLSLTLALLSRIKDNVINWFKWFGQLTALHQLDWWRYIAKPQTNGHSHKVYTETVASVFPQIIRWNKCWYCTHLVFNIYPRCTQKTQSYKTMAICAYSI